MYSTSNGGLAVTPFLSTTCLGTYRQLLFALQVSNLMPLFWLRQLSRDDSVAGFTVYFDIVPDTYLRRILKVPRGSAYPKGVCEFHDNTIAPDRQRCNIQFLLKSDAIIYSYFPARREADVSTERRGLAMLIVMLLTEGSSFLCTLGASKIDWSCAEPRHSRAIIAAR